MRRPNSPVVAAFVTLGAAVLGFACNGDPKTNRSVLVTMRDFPDAQLVDPPDPADPPKAVDAGAKDACPKEVVDYVPGSYLPRKPPRDGTDACEDGQTTEVVSACELQESSCAALDSSLTPCAFCIFTRDTDATYGFRTLVTASATQRLNVRGYALRTGATQLCANTIEDYAGCLESACSCAKADRKATCFARARGAVCESASSAIAGACAGHPSAAFLVPIIEENAFAKKDDAISMAKAICGGS